MSFVVVGGERFALEMGCTILGGQGEGALDAQPLAQLPPFAVVEYPVDGPSTVRALGSLPVLLNGAPLGAAPVELKHGDRMLVNGIVIAVGEMRMAGRTALGGGATEETPVSLPMQSAAAPTACTGGRLVLLSDGSIHRVPDEGQGLTIGREPSSGVVLKSKDVSRTHAVIEPSLLGYKLTDVSVNGVSVNGAPIDGSCVLGQHDVIRIGQDEFRFEADAASFEAAVAFPEAEPSTAPAVTPTQERAARLLGSLEVLSDGPLKGVRFRLERSTIQIGRGACNDVQLANESVSTTHASLVQAGSTWTVFDLGSRNGTYVEGEIVRGQRELPDVCEIQLGVLKVLFRAINSTARDAKGTVGVIDARRVRA